MAKTSFVYGGTTLIKLSDTTWDNEEIDAINECLLSDELTMGNRVKEFEFKFSKYIGTKHAVMVNSGSSANLLAANAISLINKPLYPKNVVLVPSVSWSTTYFPWIQNGFRLKFVDINLENYNLDLSKLKNNIDENCVGISVPHILGSDAGIDEIMKIATKNNLWVVEDTCESLGARTDDGRLLGSKGIFGTFSFFRSHHICTMEGGMITTNNTEHYHLLRSLRAHGWSRDIPNSTFLGNVKSDIWADKFKFYLPGFNLRPLEMSGAIGLKQLDKLEKFIQHRRENAEILTEELSKNLNFKVQDQGNFGSWMTFGLVIQNDNLNRKALLSKLESEGFETRPIVSGNFVKQPVIDKIREHCIFNGTYENAEYLDQKGFMIANHGKDLSQEVMVFADIINSFK
jgi:CDP-6-deoxy-D-xylo-4-hexulose-3-dehydrase